MLRVYSCTAIAYTQWVAEEKAVRARLKSAKRLDAGTRASKACGQYLLRLLDIVQ